LRKLVIHAGFHKTGTTALQHALNHSVGGLNNHGWHYPVISHGASQSDSALALGKRGWGWKGRGAKVIPLRVWTKLVAKINCDKRNIVISSEFLSELDADAIQQIKKAFPERDIEIVFTLRALDKLFPSNFQQTLKAGGDLDYDTWLSRILADYDKGQRSAFWKRNKHSAVISKWIDVFGVERVTVVTANESDSQALFTRFSKVLGLPQGVLQKSPSSGMNRSLTLEEMQLLLSVNCLYPKQSNWNEYQTFVKRGFVDLLTASPVQANEKGSVLKVPKEQAKRILEICEIEFENLKALDVKVVGALDELAPGKVMVGDNAEVTSIDIAKVASVLARQDFSLLSGIAPKSLLVNWLPYLEHKLPKFVARKIIKRR
jgi:hypothetical protein